MNKYYLQVVLPLNFKEKNGFVFVTKVEQFERSEKVLYLSAGWQTYLEIVGFQQIGEMGTWQFFYHEQKLLNMGLKYFV